MKRGFGALRSKLQSYSSIDSALASRFDELVLRSGTAETANENYAELLSLYNQLLKEGSHVAKNHAYEILTEVYERATGKDALAAIPQSIPVRSAVPLQSLRRMPEKDSNAPKPSRGANVGASKARERLAHDDAPHTPLRSPIILLSLFVAAILVIPLFFGPNITGLLGAEQTVSQLIDGSSTLALQGVPGSLVFSGNWNGLGRVQAFALFPDGARLLAVDTQRLGGVSFGTAADTPIEFSGECVDTCLFVGTSNELTLEYVAENGGELTLSEVTYTLPNEAPRFVADSNVIDVDGSVTVDLDTWFVNPEGEQLTYLANAPIGILLAVDGSQLQIAPEPGFTQDTITIIASDGSAITKQDILVRNMPKSTPTGASVAPTPATTPVTPAPSENVTTVSAQGVIQAIDRAGNVIPTTITVEPVMDEEAFGIGVADAPATAMVTLEFEDSVIDRIQIMDLTIGPGIAATQYIAVDDVPESAVPELPVGRGWTEVYALNPLASFTDAQVTVTAKGNRVYKCRDWDFDARRCDGEWTFLFGVQPGQDYGFTLSASDPAFGEINITDADHLDEDYVWLSDIFAEVQHKDDVWSEEIPDGHYVRAIFEKFLTNGNVINIFARPTVTPSTLTVYEGGTTHAVGSVLFEGEKPVDITLKGMNESIDVFDFKVAGGLEFDYIHDAIGEEGWFIYANTSYPGQPLMLNWTGTIENRPAALYAPDLGADITMQKFRCSKTRAECYLLSALSDRSLHFLVWTNATRSWAMTTLTTDSGFNGSQFFDIECEDVTGDCLIVFEPNNTADNTFAYMNYSGGVLSNTATVSNGLETTNGRFKFLRLYPKFNNDSIGIGMQNSAVSPEISAGLWNGSFWHSFMSMTINGAQLDRRSFDCAWDLNGVFNCFFGNTTDGLFLHNYGGTWVNRGLAWNIVAQAWEVDVCGSDPLTNGLTHDLIGMITCDQDADTNVHIWNATARALKSTPPTEDGITECGANKINGLATTQHQCQWEQADAQAVFVYVDNGAATPESAIYTMATNTWNIAGLATGTSVGNAWGNDPNTLLLTPHGDADTMMLSGNDIVADTECTQWTGSAWSATNCQLLDAFGPTLNTSFSAFDYWRQEATASVACPLTVSTSTTLDGNMVAAESCITITGDNLTLDCAGNTIVWDTSGLGYAYAIGAEDRRNITIKNCIMKGSTIFGPFEIGINFTNVTNSSVFNNYVQTNGTNDAYAVIMRDNSTSVQLINNTFRTQGTDARNFGVFLTMNSSNNTIKENTIISNGTLTNMGIRLENGTSNNLIFNNTITTNGNQSSNIGIYMVRANSGNTIIGNQINTSGNQTNYGVYSQGLLNANNANISITNNTIRANGTLQTNIGVFFDRTIYGNVSHNNIHTDGNSTNYGVNLQLNSTYALIFNNTIATDGNNSNNIGIRLSNVSFSNITKNIIRTNGNNSNYGISSIGTSENATIKNNSILAGGTDDSNYGIYVERSFYFNITSNTVFTNGTFDDFGIRLQNNASHTIVFNNSVDTNGKADQNYGISLSNASYNNISGNTVFTNGTSDSDGITLKTSSMLNIIVNNTISTYANISLGVGIDLSNVSYANVTRNNIMTGINATNYGILIGTGSSYIILGNNTIDTNGINRSNIGIAVANATFNIVDGNVILTNGSETNYGMALYFGAQNTSITNNSITTGSTEDYNVGVALINGRNGPGSSRINISNNVIFANGSQRDYGVLLLDNASFNIIFNNSIRTGAYGTGNIGVRVDNASTNNISGNTIFTNASRDSDGVDILGLISVNNQIINNTIHTIANNTLAVGIAIEVGAFNTTAIANVIQTHGNGSNFGILLGERGKNTTVLDNIIRTNGENGSNWGIAVQNHSYAFVARNWIQTNGTLSPGIRVGLESENNTFVDNNVTTLNYSSSGVELTFSTGSNFTNLLISNPGFWIETTQPTTAVNFTNLTFETGNGTLTFNSTFEINGTANITHRNLNITNNRVHLNESSFLNLSANIVLYDISMTDPRPAVDLDDTGTFVTCPADLCTEIDYTGTTFRFNVSHWTAFAAEDATPPGLACGDTITTSQTMTEDLSGTGGCITFGANNIFLNCNGFKITFDTSGSGNVAAITANGRTNVNVTNCFIQDGNAAGEFGIGINYTNTNSGTIRNNTILTNGTIASWGVLIETGTGNSVYNNTIRAQADTIATSASSSGYGVYLITSTYNRIRNNTILANGTNYSIGVYLDRSQNISVGNNTITTAGTRERNYGIYLNQSASMNNLTENVITTSGTFFNGGIRLETGNNDTLIANNSILANGTSNGNEGIFLAVANNRNRMLGNYISTNGTTTNYGIRIFGSGDYNTIAYNDIWTNGTTTTNNGLRLDNTSYGNFSYNNITTNGNRTSYGIYLLNNASYNLVDGNMISTDGQANENSSAATRWTQSVGILLDDAHFSNATRNIIRTNGSGQNYGIWFFTATQNATVTNNSIMTNGNGSANYGIYVQSVTRNNITDNTIFTNGTQDNFGTLFFAANNTQYRNNTVFTNGSSAYNFGLMVWGSNYTNITDNRVRTFGTHDNDCINLQFGTHNNSVVNNSGICEGTQQLNAGIALNAAQDTNVSDNRMETSGTDNNYGLYLDGSRNRVHNNVFNATGTNDGSYGIYLTPTILATNSNNLSHNTIYTSCGSNCYGIALWTSAASNLLFNNTILGTSGTTSPAIYLTASTGNQFVNTTIANPQSWFTTVATMSANFTNTTFVTENGSIRITERFNISRAVTITHTQLNITFNRTLISAGTFPELNQTAVILLNLSTANGLVDPYPLYAHDNVTFIECPVEICTEISFTDGMYAFNVSHWTAFAASESPARINITKTDNFDPVNASSELNYTILINVTAGNATNITVSDLYPVGSVFQSASPAPEAGTTDTFKLPNLSVGQLYTLNISIITPNASNGSYLNNTANVSFFGVAGALSPKNVTENTTIVNGDNVSVSECRTLDMPVTYRLTQDLLNVLSPSCFNMTANGTTLDCNGYNITGSQVANSHGINSSTRFNLTIRNCKVYNFTDGVFFTRVRNATIFNSTFGNNTDDGIDFSNVNTSVISHINLTSNADTGIEITGWFVNITNSSFSNMRGAVTAHGLQAFRASSTVPGSGPASLRIINNTFIDNQNDGLNTAWLNDSVIANNTFSGSGDDAMSITNGTSINITGNNMGNGGDDGILLQGTNYSFIAHNNVSERPGQNLDIVDSSNNNFTNNTLFYGNFDVLRLRYASVNNTFWNMTLFSNNSWFTVNNTATENNNFTNTTFANSNGSILLSFFQANITQEVNTTTLNISSNRAYLNATNLSNMNVSAIITLNTTGLSFTTPEIGVDYGDTLTYVTCPADVCNASSVLGSQYLFNVSHWTSFRVQEAITALACGDTITTSQTMTEDLSGTGTCITFGASDIILDCAGFKITYDSSGSGEAAGVTAAGRSGIAIKNCFIQDGSIAGANGVGVNFSAVTTSNITNNTILTNGTSENFGIRVQGASINDRVSNNTVFAYTGASGQGRGIAVLDSSGASNVTGNIVFANGTTSAQGLYAYNLSDNLTVWNNTFWVNVSSTGAYGIYLANSSRNNITGNIIEAQKMPGGGAAVYLTGAVLESGSQFNALTNNSFFVRDLSVVNDVYGIYATGATVRYNNFTNNRILTGRAIAYGVYLQNVNDHRVENNTINGTKGVYLFYYSLLAGNNASFNTVIRNHIRDGTGIDVSSDSYNNSILHNFINNTATGISLSGGFNNISNNTVIALGTGIIAAGGNNSYYDNNITATGTSGIGISILGNQSNFTNTILSNNSAWIRIGEGYYVNFTNTTFENAFGSIRFQYNLSMNGTRGINFTNLNLSLNFSRVNITNLSFMNASAFITLNGLTHTDPQPSVDFTDLDTFTTCAADTCTEISYVNNVFRFNVSHWTSFAAEETPGGAPTRPLNLYPVNDTNIVDRFPNFNWSNSTVTTGLIPNYSLVISTTKDFAPGDIFFNKTNINQLVDANTTNQSINLTLDVDTAYWWRVVAFDGTQWGDPSNISNFTVQSFLSITLVNRTVNFTTAPVGYQNDTEDDWPTPFWLENTGNLPVNITVSGDRLFISSSVDYPTALYRYRIGINETGAFNDSNSTMLYTNMTFNRTLRTDINDLNWSNSTDNVFIHINITVPLDEPAGLRNTSVNFTITP